MTTESGATVGKDDQLAKIERRADVSFVPLPRIGFLHIVLWAYAIISLVTGTVAGILIGSIGMAVLFSCVAAVVGWYAYRAERALTRDSRTRFGERGTPLPAGASGAEAGAWCVYAHSPRLVGGGLSRDRGKLWRAMQDSASRAASPLPDTLAAAALTESLRRIDLIEDLIEPEFVVPSLPGGFGAVLLSLAVSGFVIYRSVVAGDWTAAVFWCVLLSFTALGSPAIRQRIPALRAESGAPVAAPGIIRDRKKREWLRGSAVMIVQVVGRSGGVMVGLIGPAGVLRLSFSSAKDEDFINLWQRWNHPHPRPELLTE